MSEHGTPESRPEPPPSPFSEDLDALSAVMAERFDEFDSETFKSYASEIIADPHSELIVVRGCDGAIIGGVTAVLSRDGHRNVGWIYDAAAGRTETDDTYGEVLVSLATDWLSYRGANPVVLDTRPNLGVRHRPGEARPFDPRDPSLIKMSLSKAVEYGKLHER